MFSSPHERCRAGFINRLTLKFAVWENTSCNQPHLSTVGVSVPVYFFFPSLLYPIQPIKRERINPRPRCAVSRSYVALEICLINHTHKQRPVFATCTEALECFIKSLKRFPLKQAPPAPCQPLRSQHLLIFLITFRLRAPPLCRGLFYHLFYFFTTVFGRLVYQAQEHLSPCSFNLCQTQHRCFPHTSAQRFLDN